MADVPTTAEGLEGVEPDALLTDPSLRYATTSRGAAARALAYAHATGARAYDEIGTRLTAAMPVDDVAPLQTVRAARSARAREDRLRPDARAERALAEQPKLRHRPLDLRLDGRYSYAVDNEHIHLTRAYEDASGREREEPWTFPLTTPPAGLLKEATPDDAPQLFTQRFAAEIPGAAWLPLRTVIAQARFPRMQECRDELVGETEPGAYYCFLSHRWLATEEPDPDGRQARFTAWQFVAHLCEAVRVAELRGLHEPRVASRALGFVVGIAGAPLAEALLVNVLRPALHETTLRAAVAEVSPLEADTTDFGVSHAESDEGLARLRGLLADRPVLSGLIDRIYVWYDFSCVPQPPRDGADEQLFRETLANLNAYQVLGRTAVLLDEAEDYLSRAWCTLEALAAYSISGEPELLVGSERHTAREGRAEQFLVSLLSDRPHIVWRAVLDTEVFRLQSPEECLARLELAATDPADLSFIYTRLRDTPAPTSVHTDGSEIVTGVFPLPVTSDGAAVVPRSGDRSVSRRNAPPERRSLDWTGALTLSTAWSDGHDASISPLSIVGSGTGCHVAVLAACEGEAVLLATWALEHHVELEELLQTRVGSLSWLATDVAAVGHLPCGTLRAAPIDAPLWALVSMDARFGHTKVVSAIREALARAGTPHVEVSVDVAEGGVVSSTSGDEDAECDLVPADTPFPTHPGGLLRDALLAELV